MFAVLVCHALYFYGTTCCKIFFLLVGDFSFTNLVRDAQFIRTHIFQFVRFPVPADEYRDLFTTFGSLILRLRPNYPFPINFLFLVIELVFMERALQLLFIIWMPCSLNLTVPSCAVYNEIFASVGVR